MAGWKSPRLSVYAALLFVSVGLVQLAASLSFYRAIDEQTLLDDHARRVAELLVVSNRVLDLDAGLTPSIMTSRHLGLTVSPRPIVARPSIDDDLEQIAAKIVEWEPSLAGKPLHLATRPAGSGRRDLLGSMQLGEGRWLNFQSRDISSMWPVALRATWMTLVTALICLGVGLIAIRLLTQPLRRLSEAAGIIGKGQRAQIHESGPTDLRNLAQAMNEMQDRIARLLEDQAKSFEAISHDLRTPLSRQKLAAELIEAEDIREIMDASVDEMETMLQSLQQYLRAQHLAAEPEPVDLRSLIVGLIEPYRDRILLDISDRAVAETYREPLTLSLQALVENACRFGDKIEVIAWCEGGDWVLEIADDGPGIAPEYREEVLAPFVRLDPARGRTTKGFGLGIPTAHRLLTRFGGKLSLLGGPGEGLRVRVKVPRPA